MKHWALMVLVGLAGCGATSSPAPDNSLAGRVTPDLREACLGESDVELQAVISIYQVIKDEGASQAEALRVIVGACELTYVDLWDCVTCGTLIIDAVYN